MNEWKVPVEESIIRDTSISDKAFRLYCLLLGYARESKTCYPTITQLAKGLGCTEKYVIRLNNELKKAGLLNWKKVKHDDNSYPNNLYILLKYKPIMKKM